MASRGGVAAAHVIDGRIPHSVLLEIVTNDRQRTTRAMMLTNAFFYTEFTHDTLRRVRDGRPVSLTEGGRPRMNPIYVDDAVAAIIETASQL